MQNVLRVKSRSELYYTIERIKITQSILDIKTSCRPLVKL